MADTFDRDIDKLIEIAKAIDACGGKTYYIGGFVRDRLMGLPNKDVDVEVHGVPVDVLRNLLEQFGEVITIGKSFGVYSIRGYDIDIAVPRKEKNTGRGHRDFEIYTDPFLGVETAARRRDFTINAMMQDVLTGEIVDCFSGQEDLKEGILRHIDADSFVEDPLRVLRAAQFAARFEFEIAEETVDLCRTIDLSALPSERIEGELRKALCKGRKPSLFFEMLRKMNQLDCWFPELASLIGLQQDPVFHPEGDVWTHVMTVLDKAAAYRDQTSEPFRFMLVPLAHDLGKIETTEVVNGRIHSYQHEKVGVPIAECFVRRITNDTSIIRYVKNMTELHMRPNMVAYSKSSVKATNRLFDEAVSPYDLILFSVVDMSSERYEGEGEDNLQFLLERLEIFKELMERPHVTGQDLIDAGLEPGTDFKEILSYAHKLRLAGIPKELALKQVLSYARKMD
ncbi:MAG: tRNA nucleotidyltransferase [Firmicutes bacterium]|nr:tRNA nucleotidyltransferase [Bacillota bacterium]